jgi:cytochrome c peroxidase
VLAGVELGAATLALDMELRWNGAALTVPSMTMENAAGQRLRLTRVAGLIAGVELSRADGSRVRLDGQYGRFDFGAGKTGSTFVGVPEGEYTGLEFEVGLPRETNHGDPGRWPAGHPLHPLTNGLHWSWQGGYVFLAIEGRWRESDGRHGEAAVAVAAEPAAERGFLYHLATEPRRMRVGFAANFRVERATTVGLAFDVGRVLREWRWAEDDGSESTHSAEGDTGAERLARAAARAWFWREATEEAPGASEEATVEAKPSVRGWAGGTPRAFAVPAGFPQPELPADNPLTEEGVALGRSLFSDTRLSGNGTQSCASCHVPERAFSDMVPASRGVRGAEGTRNAMPLFNLAWGGRFGWDGAQSRIRDQSLAALRNPVEMDGDPARVVAALAADPERRRQFAAAFGEPEPTLERVGLALEQFQLTLVAAESRFDRALRGAAELTEEEKRGFELFVTEYDPVRGRNGADCFHCHGGALFTDADFKHNGLPARAGAVEDDGRAKVTGRAADRGKFKTPSLRNVAVTGPYMHDGRFATLEDVVAHYAGGVERSTNLDANLAKHPRGGVPLKEADQRALVAFLRALTEESLPGGL